MRVKAIILITWAMLIISCNKTEEHLTPEEKEQIKTEVISSIEKHVEDIISQDYNKVMQFYNKDDYVIYGDGTYWGDYSAIDDIWKTWLPKWQAITKWTAENHKIHVYSRDAAVDIMEWDHERIEEDGDTTRAYGSFVWGMQRFPDGWKSVYMVVDHRYTAGPWPNVKK